MYSDEYSGGGDGPVPNNAGAGRAYRRPFVQQQRHQPYIEEYDDDPDIDDDASPSPSFSGAAAHFGSHHTNGGGDNNHTSSLSEMDLIDRIQTQLELTGRHEEARQFVVQYRQLMKDATFSRRRDMLEMMYASMPPDELQQPPPVHPASSPSADGIYEEIPSAQQYAPPPQQHQRQNVMPYTNNSNNNGPTSARPPFPDRHGGLPPARHLPHSATLPNVGGTVYDDRSVSSYAAAVPGMTPTARAPTRHHQHASSSVSARYHHAQQQQHYNNAVGVPSSSSSATGSGGANFPPHTHVNNNMRESSPPEYSPYFVAGSNNNNFFRIPAAHTARSGMAPSVSYQQLPNPSVAGGGAATAYGSTATLGTLPRSSSHAQFLPPPQQILSPHVEDVEGGDIVSDWELIKDLVKVCNGIDGQYVRLGEMKCELYVHVRINPAYAQIGLQIAHVGWLTSQIRTYIERRRDRGYVKEGLYAGIQERLASLESDIVALDSQIHVEDQETFPSYERLTLAKLYALMIEPLKRLAVMLDIVRHVDALKGGEIVNYLYTQADEGDRDKRSTVVGLLSACVRPVFFMISHWLYHGQTVRDECGEFFIRSVPLPVAAEQSNNSSMPSESSSIGSFYKTPPPNDNNINNHKTSQPQQAVFAAWHAQFILIDEQVPRFISSDMAHKIFIAGQTTCFLRTFCGDRAIPDFDREIMPLLQPEEIDIADAGPDTIGDNNNVDSVEIDKRKRANQMSASTAAYSHLSQLWSASKLRLDSRASAVFIRMHSLASRTLLATLHDEFHLSWHIEAIVNYMLHKRGDFIVELIELLRVDLERDAGTFTASSDIHGAIRLAVEHSSARTDPPEVLTNLSGDFDKKVASSDLGWDLFSIRYRIDDGSPLQIIFTPDIMLRLRKMWRFIWRVKRADYLLGRLWWNAQTMFGKSHSDAVDDMACHGMLERLIVTEMLQFVQQLEHYICFEVVAVSHAHLLEALGKATELRDLIVGMETFVTQLEERLFLKTFDEITSTRVRSILTCVNAVQKCHDALFSLIKLRSNLMTTSSTADKSNNTSYYGQQQQQQHAGGTGVADESAWAVLCARNYDELRRTYVQFQNLMMEFLQGLLSSSDDNMQALHFRLDYTHYYQRLKASYSGELQSYLLIPQQQQQNSNLVHVAKS